MHILSVKEEPNGKKLVTLLLAANGNTFAGFQSALGQAVASIWSASWIAAMAAGSNVVLTIVVGKGARILSNVASLNIDVSASVQGVTVLAGVTVKAFRYTDWDQSFRTPQEFVETVLGTVEKCVNERLQRSSNYATSRRVEITIQAYANP